jgi:hypothetical protein
MLLSNKFHTEENKNSYVIFVGLDVEKFRQNVADAGFNHLKPGQSLSQEFIKVRIHIKNSYEYKKADQPVCASFE